MPSTLSIAEVARIAQVTSADVIRVIRSGGTTEADWAIAHAIQAAGGRSAYELMLTAGRDQVIAEIWGDAAGAPAQAPAPTNDLAVYDPEVRVYAEPTAPDAPQTALPDHPYDGGEDDPLAARDAQASTVHADLVDLTDEPDTAERISRRWASPVDAVHQAARRTVQQLLLDHPRTRRRAAHRARRPRRTALAA